MPHPNSLMYNVYAIPFWPMKVYWTLRKVINSKSWNVESNPSFLCVDCEYRVDQRLPHPSWEPPWCQDQQSLHYDSRTPSLNVIKSLPLSSGGTTVQERVSLTTNSPDRSLTKSAMIERVSLMGVFNCIRISKKHCLFSSFYKCFCSFGICVPSSLFSLSI